MTTPNSFFDDSLERWAESIGFGKVIVKDRTYYMNPRLSGRYDEADLRFWHTVYLTHRNTELEKLLERADRIQLSDNTFTTEVVVPVSAIQDLIKKGE